MPTNDNNVEISTVRSSFIFVGVVLLAVIGFIFFQIQSPKDQMPQPTQVNQQTSTNFKFREPKKSAHYESNTPAYGAVLAGAPINVVVDFNFDLAKPSAIKILQADKDYGIGETVLDTNKLSMRRKMNSDAPNGLYTVKYNACWPDGSCHDGSFEFVIDRTQSSTFVDQAGKKEVTINMSELMFKPQDIKISRNTKVTWINDEEVGHYINTDSHPAHTYYPAQNSKLLSKGESFSLIFEQSGIYPYHCSAHAEVMTGNLLVE